MMKEALGTENIHRISAGFVPLLLLWLLFVWECWLKLPQVCTMVTILNHLIPGAGALRKTANNTFMAKRPWSVEQFWQLGSWTTQRPFVTSVGENRRVEKPLILSTGASLKCRNTILCVSHTSLIENSEKDYFFFLKKYPSVPVT